MKENFLKSLRLTLVSIIFFSGIYSMVVLGFTKALVPGGGSVQLTNPSGVNTGGINIGQSFSDSKYFWGNQYWFIRELGNKSEIYKQIKGKNERKIHKMVSN